MPARPHPPNKYRLALSALHQASARVCRGRRSAAQTIWGCSSLPGPAGPVHRDCGRQNSVRGPPVFSYSNVTLSGENRFNSTARTSVGHWTGPFSRMGAGPNIHPGNRFRISDNPIATFEFDAAHAGSTFPHLYFSSVCQYTVKLSLDREKPLCLNSCFVRNNT